VAGERDGLIGILTDDTVGADVELRVTLRRLRRARGLSQRDLTGPLNLTAHSAIVDYESGRRIPPPDILAAYERHFELQAGGLQLLRERALRERAAAEALLAVEHPVSVPSALEQLRAAPPATPPGGAAEAASLIKATPVIPDGRGQAPATGQARATGQAGAPGMVPMPYRFQPAQLPPTVTDFTGRKEELAWAQRCLAEFPGTPLTLSGPPGVGKTTVAIRLAHLLRDRFCDGQLFVDLRGSDACRARSAEALAMFLRGLGVPNEEIPDDAGERSCMFRSLTADGRFLVLLDNAFDEAQVRPLLPASPGCLTLITSTRLLVGLEGARTLILDMPPGEEALELLARVAGRARIAAEEAAARDVVRCCGRLPLAVRIAGARLAARPAWPVAEIAARLGDERSRLSELAVGDLQVRAALAACHGMLGPAARRVFRCLGSIAGTVPHFTADHVMAATVLAASEVEAALEHLADVSLVHALGGRRYRLHDLVRLYAAERVHAEGEESAALFSARPELLSAHGRAVPPSAAWHSDSAERDRLAPTQASLPPG